MRLNPTISCLKLVVVKLMRTSIFPALALATFCLVGCSDSSNQLRVTEPADPGPRAILDGPLDVHGELVLDSIDPAIGASIALSDTLLANGDLEQGTDSWFDCKGSTGASITTDAASGAAALAIPAGNCVYNTSTSVSPGDEIVLTCDTRLSDSGLWSGLGVGFSNISWESVGDAPSALVTSTKYTSYSVSTTVPFNTHYTTVWFYSDSDATIDNCEISIDLAGGSGKENDAVPTGAQPDGPDTPDTAAGNLLSNPDFQLSANGSGITDWFIGCDSAGIAQVYSVGSLELAGGACIAQSLSTETITALRGNNYLFECEVRGADSAEYTDIVLGFDGVEIAESEIENGFIKISGKAPDKLTNGFVGVYSERPANNPLQVNFCSVTIEPASVTVVPSATPVEPETEILKYRKIENTIEVARQVADGWEKIAEIAAPDGTSFGYIFSGANPEEFFVRTSLPDTEGASINYYSRIGANEWALQQTIAPDTRQFGTLDYTPVYDTFPSAMYVAGDIMVAQSRFGVYQTRTFGVSESHLDIYRKESGVWQHVTGVESLYPGHDNISEVLVTATEIFVSARKFRHPPGDLQIAVLQRNEGGPDNWGLSQMIPNPDISGFGRSLALSGGVLSVGSAGSIADITTNYVRNADGKWTLASDSDGEVESREAIDIRNNLEGYDDWMGSSPYRFEITLHNPGTEALTDVTVSSDLIDSCSFSYASLAVGETITEYCSTNLESGRSGTVNYSVAAHTMTAEAMAPSGNTISDSDYARALSRSQTPRRSSLAIISDKLSVSAGDNVTFTVEAASTGSLGSSGDVTGIESDFANCSVSFDPPLQANSNQANISRYSCVLENVQLPSELNFRTLAAATQIPESAVVTIDASGVITIVESQRGP